ncbi:MAG: LamG-like jellyroll fold domain-containing protein, partial [Candidatus Poribacteria bacterium]
LANLPDPATFTSPHNVGPARTFASNPATVILEDQTGNAAVVVREFGDGRVVGMHHTGNYTLANPLQDTTLQQVYIDAVLWVSGVTDPPLPYPANSAVHLDGSDDYIVIGDSSVLDFGPDDDFTVEAWIRPWATQTDLGADTNSVIEKWDGSGGYPYAIRYGNQSGSRSGHVWGARYDGSSYAEAVSSSTVADGTFHHVAFVKSGSALSLYVDGTLEGSATDTTSGATANASSFYIGRTGSGAGSLRGSVDDVRVWSVARTEIEIQNALYKTLLGSEAGLNRHWAFNDLTASDVTPNMNDGAAVNGAGISASAPVFVSNSAPTPTSGLSEQVSEGATTQIAITGSDSDSDLLSFALESSTSNLGIALTLTDDDPTDNVATVSYTALGVKGVDGFAFTVADGLLTSSSTDVGIEIFLAANSAASLDGADDYVLIPDAATLDISAGGDFSLSLWVKTGDASNSPRIASKRESVSDTIGYEVYLDSGDGAARVLFDPGGGGATLAVVGSTSIVDDAWHHVAFAISGSTANLYVDGFLDGSTTDAGLAVGFASAADLLLGASLTVAGAELNGMADEVRAWSSARTETQVQAVMEYTLTGAESNLVGYWTFDSGVVNDLTLNGADGSTVNGAIITASSKSFITNTVAPVAVDTSATTWEDTPVLITLDASDADGNPLVFTSDSILTQTSNGRVVVDTDDSSPTYGQATYSPFLDYSGADAFTWYVTDGINASNTATVAITVSAVDDTPTTGGFVTLYSDGFTSGGGSTTVDPDITLAWSTSSVGASPNGQEFLGSDLEYGFGNETASLTLGALPSHTEVFVDFDLYVIQAWEGHGSGGGPDIWTLLADGATVISTSFSNTNDAPQSYPTDYDGGSPTDNGAGRGAAAHNTLGYLGHVEASQYPTGSPWDDVTYRVSLAFPHTTDALTLDFAAVGLEAVYDESWGLDNLSVSVNSDTTDEDTPISMALAGSDADGDALTYTVTASPANGSTAGGATVTYTPSQDFNGEDTFSYTVTDGSLTSAASTVTVTVAAVNDAPTSDTQFFTSLDATPITVTMSGDDVESDPLTFSLTDGGSVTSLTTSNGGIVEEGVAQWAGAVVDYSSECSASNWSASQALGIPTTFSYGDITTSWAPSAQNDGEQWIELGFTTPVYATGAIVRETYGNGFVTQIDVSGPSTGLTTVWAGSDTTAT